MDRTLVEGHRSRSNDHAKSADEIKLLGGVREWEMVIRFYSSLRLLDAYLETKGIRPKGHPERSQQVNSTPELSTGKGTRFKAAYKRLRELSEQVRYTGVFTANQSHIDFCRNDHAVVLSILKPKIETIVPSPPQAIPGPPAVGATTDSVGMSTSNSNEPSEGQAPKPLGK